jgi:hypothetical protein
MRKKLYTELFALTLLLSSPIIAIADEYVTSITQFKDITGNEPYYDDLQSLAERYGILYVGADHKFRGNDNLTREEATVILERAFSALTEIKEVAVPNSPSKFDPFNLTGAKIKSIKDLKDVTASNSYYEALQTLVEKYQVVIADATEKGLMFNPKKSISTREASLILEKSAGYKELKSANTPITRGEFAIHLNRALDNYEASLY